MYPYELIAVAFLASVAFLAWVLPVGRRRRIRVSLTGGALILAIIAIARTGNETLRAWAPHLYLVSGYWLPALLVSHWRWAGFESWLTRVDARVRRHLPGVPSTVRGVFEVAYMLCYPLVPLAFSIVWWRGGAAEIGRFWSSVLLAGFSCYGTIPWLVCDPPWLRIKRERGRDVAALNAFVLRRVSHQLNTFPSGHVAVAAAAAAGVAVVSPVAGAMVALVAAAIAVGAVAGGYHYAVDVILGMVVAAAAVLTAGWI